MPLTHSGDLHLGRRFGGYPEDLRGHLVEARHNAIHQLFTAAQFHEANHILIAGDLFDSEAPTDPVWRQELTAMGANPEHHWWIIRGNHNSVTAESLWSRIREQPRGNVNLVDDVEPVEIAPNVFLLPAPFPATIQAAT